MVWLPRSIPDFGRFYGSHGAVLVDAVLAKNLPQRSRANEFTDGRVYEFRRVKDRCPLDEYSTSLGTSLTGESPKT